MTAMMMFQMPPADEPNGRPSPGNSNGMQHVDSGLNFRQALERLPAQEHGRPSMPHQFGHTGSRDGADPNHDLDGHGPPGQM